MIKYLENLFDKKYYENTLFEKIEMKNSVNILEIFNKKDLGDILIKTDEILKESLITNNCYFLNMHVLFEELEEFSKENKFSFLNEKLYNKYFIPYLLEIRKLTLIKITQGIIHKTFLVKLKI